MIPILYDAKETEFKSNGLGRLADCTRCIVTEERNGIYECEFDYPADGEMFDLIQEGCVIAVTHDDGHDIQPFDIYGRSAELGKVVTFYAHHISYRLNHVILRPFSAASCAEALSKLKTSVFNTNPFTFWTDKSVSAQFVNSIPTSVRALLAGQSGSILDVYGSGEYLFDGFDVKLYAQRGNDNGVSIRYGVNLLGLDQTFDKSSYHTAVAPYWRSPEDGSVVMLPEGYIIYSGAETHLEPWTDERGNQIEDGRGNPIYISIPEIVPAPMDLTDAFEEQPTVDQLRAEALRRLNNSDSWLPTENIKVDFIDLAQTTEYASVAALQRVRLCDRVSVYCGPMGVNAVSMQVIKVVYDTLAERYDEIEIGKPRQSYAETLLAGVDEAIRAATAQMATVDEIQAAVASATRHITGATNSHVKLNYDANGGLTEILIMDTDDIETAVKVWRWNSGGLGFSSNGYAGPYNLAMTADGAIVADRITSGTLNADIIRAGKVGAAYIDADSLQVKAANITGTLSASQIEGGTLKLGGANNGNGSISVYDASEARIGYWDNTGLHISSGVIEGASISNRSGNTFGFEVGPHGDIAVGVKPDDMSSFDGNKSPLQINNWGRMKISEVQLWAANASGIYEQMGSISGDYANQRININGNVAFGGDVNAVTSLTINNTAQVNAVRGGYVKLGHMVVFTVQIQFKYVSGLNDPWNLVKGFPAPAQVATFPVNLNDTGAGGSASQYASLAGSFLHLKGSYSSGAIVNVSGAYICT